MIAWSRSASARAEVVLRAQKIAPPEKGGCVAGIDDDRLIEILQRQIVFFDLAIGQRPIGVSAGEIRIDFDRVREVVDRVGIAPELGVDDAARVVSGRVTRIALDDLGQRCDIAGVGGLCCGVGLDLGHMRVGNPPIVSLHAASIRNAATCRGQCPSAPKRP